MSLEPSIHAADIVSTRVTADVVVPRKEVILSMKQKGANVINQENMNEI